jgi:hypothetical protein
LFDSRSYEEFHGNSIPTAIKRPGRGAGLFVAELVRPGTMVIELRRRTRSIIGAQSLINAGVPNKVVSLKNGTQAALPASIRKTTARPPAGSRPACGGTDGRRIALQSVSMHGSTRH